MKKLSIGDVSKMMSSVVSAEDESSIIGNVALYAMYKKNLNTSPSGGK